MSIDFTHPLTLWVPSLHADLLVGGIKKTFFDDTLSTCRVAPESKISSVQFSHSVVFDSL